MSKTEYMKAYALMHYAKYRAKYIEKACVWQAANRERKAAYDKARRDAKRLELNAYDKARSSAVDRLAAKRDWSRKRKMTVKQATPMWVSEDDKNLIAAIYKLAVIYSKETGTRYCVDHIVPLHGVNVCGLHVPSNLQVIDEQQNQRKRNRHFELDRLAYP